MCKRYLTFLVELPSQQELPAMPSLIIFIFLLIKRENYNVPCKQTPERLNPQDIRHRGNRSEKEGEETSNRQVERKIKSYYSLECRANSRVHSLGSANPSVWIFIKKREENVSRSLMVSFPPLDSDWKMSCCPQCRSERIFDCERVRIFERERQFEGI